MPHPAPTTLPPRDLAQLKADAAAIWRAGVKAVHGRTLVREQFVLDGHWLGLPAEEHWIDLSEYDTVYVAGAGKAAAAMAQGVADVLQPLVGTKRCRGHINVPGTLDFESARHTLELVEDWRPFFSDDVTSGRAGPPLQTFVVRPPGLNFATPLAVEQTQNLCRELQTLTPRDLCVYLWSGGASALLCWPVAGISIEEKNHAVRWLAQQGAPIESINAVRSSLSQVKAGGMIDHGRPGQRLALVLSDVLGDPLDVIGSGPTWHESDSIAARAARALQVLEQFDPDRRGVPQAIYQVLERRRRESQHPAEPSPAPIPHFVIGNTATAVDAAGIEAEKRGYSHAMHVQPSERRAEGKRFDAEREGEHLANMLSQMNESSGPDCLITGGEPVVELPELGPDARGGRNQHLLVAALRRWTETGDQGFFNNQIVLVSGGTDGEDGNTPVAGGWTYGQLAQRVAPLDLNPIEALRTGRSFDFLQKIGGLILTGSTQTNVCDLRVGVVSRCTTVPPAHR